MAEIRPPKVGNDWAKGSHSDTSITKNGAGKASSLGLVLPSRDARSLEEPITEENDDSTPKRDSYGCFMLALWPTIDGQVEEIGFDELVVVLRQQCPSFQRFLSVRGEEWAVEAFGEPTGVAEIKAIQRCGSKEAEQQLKACLRSAPNQASLGTISRYCVDSQAGDVRYIKGISYLAFHIRTTAVAAKKAGYILRNSGE
ncbi:hypothetical protein BV898_15347 [Hypsibius exemplaris]|uniref:Uncharacterized protein n=1 Tax=Hypsibius exemplaris TaxID=2072580 RepID=A0A9X6RKE5_HYPEX|nr:hypothetical protein BV898_15347 [Hypsibius exemplaris]